MCEVKRSVWIVLFYLISFMTCHILIAPRKRAQFFISALHVCACEYRAMKNDKLENVDSSWHVRCRRTHAQAMVGQIFQYDELTKSESMDQIGGLYLFKNPTIISFAIFRRIQQFVLWWVDELGLSNFLDYFWFSSLNLLVELYEQDMYHRSLQTLSHVVGENNSF